MNYTEFKYLRPPRCGTAFPPMRSEFSRLERLGYKAQIKWNGANSVIFVAPDRSIDAWTRHGERHKRFRFNDENSKMFRGIPGDKWWVFNGEYLNDKGPSVKNVHFIHDVLVADGKILIGKSYEWRQSVLDNLFPVSIAGSHTSDHFVLDEHTWLARNIPDIEFAYNTYKDHPLHEGVVVKNPKGILELKDLTMNGRNAPWMLKCRHPKSSKNVRF